MFQSVSCINGRIDNKSLLWLETKGKNRSSWIPQLGQSAVGQRLVYLVILFMLDTPHKLHPIFKANAWDNLLCREREMKGMEVSVMDGENSTIAGHAWDESLLRSNTCDLMIYLTTALSHSTLSVQVGFNHKPGHNMVIVYLSEPKHFLVKETEAVNPIYLTCGVHTRLLHLPRVVRRNNYE